MRRLMSLLDGEGRGRGVMGRILSGRGRDSSCVHTPLCPPSPLSGPPSPSSPPSPGSSPSASSSSRLARQARLALGHVVTLDSTVYPVDCRRSASAATAGTSPGTRACSACSLSRIKLCWAADGAPGGVGAIPGVGVGATGSSRCPSARLRVEKIEGGLLVAGVVVAANCQLALPAFGCLFLLAGCVITAASYRGPGSDEAPENYAARVAFTENSRVLGPACIAWGLFMLIAGAALVLLYRRARRRETRLAFHCPLHGDFYPLSPVSVPKSRASSGRAWWRCWSVGSAAGRGVSEAAPPKCPHSTLSSSRSSVSSAPPSPCPTPLPFLVTEGSVSGLVATGALVSPDQTFGSIRSLSVSREVASFPLSRTPSPPSTVDRKSPGSSPPLSSAAQLCHPASPNVDEVILATARRLELPPLLRQEITLVAPAAPAPSPPPPSRPSAPRKSVSIVLPEGPGPGPGPAPG